MIPIQLCVPATPKAATAAFAGHTVGLFAVISMLVMMTYIHWQLAIRSFSLITQVPERVTRWFGQGGENIGEDRDSDRTTAILVGAVQKMEGMGRGAGVAGHRTKPGGMMKATLDTAAQGADGTGGGGNKVPT